MLDTNTVTFVQIRRGAFRETLMDAVCRVFFGSPAYQASAFLIVGSALAAAGLAAI